MMMKMHSYTSLNGDLSVKYWRLKALKEQIPKQIAKKIEDDPDLKNMEAEKEFLEEELQHGNTRYPNNVTLTNYLDYLIVPSLVYALEYPRTDR